MDSSINIRGTIRSSEFATQLAEMERWTGFQDKETREEWLDLLGPTAIVLSHQEHFTDFVEKGGQSIEKEILSILLLASAIHDMGEIKVGDIPASEKTTADEEIESVAAIAIINLLELDLENLALLEFAYKEAIAGENAVLNFLFKAFEKTEYLDTAIHVFQKLNEGLEMTHGKFLIARVLAINLPQILSFAEQLPNSIGEYLMANQELITNMFDFSEEAVTKDFAVNSSDSKKLWTEFCNQN